MKKNKLIISSFLTATIILTQLISLFHGFEHTHKDSSKKEFSINKSKVYSSEKDCLICDFFKNTEVATLPIFISITIINMSFSTPDVTHIQKKKIFYILHRKSRAPPHMV